MAKDRKQITMQSECMNNKCEVKIDKKTWFKELQLSL